MRRFINLAAIASVALSIELVSCNSEKTNADQSADYYKMDMVQPNTAVVLWNPADYDFEEGNKFYLENFAKMERVTHAAHAQGACTSWRNGNFHGRNLDWFQGSYGCIILQMPKGDNVKHASVGLLNSSTKVTQQYMKDGVISDEDKKALPCAVVDGINDAGVAININIVPHAPGSPYIDSEGDLSSQCVVRYVLDNAGSIDEAIELLKGKKIRQSIVGLAGDETHYMISDKDGSAVIEFDKEEMVVTRFKNTEKGCFSDKGTPAIMTNLYDFAIERWGIATPEFYENHPYAMGVERWNSIKEQYDNAAKSVEANLEMAKSVWYFKHFMADKSLWYTENAISVAYGKDAQGWYYMDGDKRVACDGAQAAQVGYWNAAMEGYWARYEAQFGKLSDPHVKENKFWETSHSVVYDLKAKKGYVMPFENFYSKDGKPIEFSLPE